MRLATIHFRVFLTLNPALYWKLRALCERTGGSIETVAAALIVKGLDDIDAGALKVDRGQNLA